jgi:hypothetical protein
MKFPYISATVKVPIPSLADGLTRPRPIIAARVIGPKGTQLIDGLLDTGSDDTVFEEWVAALIGVDLTKAIHRDIGLVGRVQPVRVQYAAVCIRITDGSQEIYEWTAMMGFTSTKLRYPLFGYAGFLQFFSVDFHGDDCEVIITPNKAFLGSVTQQTVTP